jgi:hypothetical protein
VLVGSLARNLSLVSAVVMVNLLGIPAHSLDLEIDFGGWQPLLRRPLWGLLVEGMRGRRPMKHLKCALVRCLDV